MPKRIDYGWSKRETSSFDHYYRYLNELEVWVIIYRVIEDDGHKDEWRYSIAYQESQYLDKKYNLEEVKRIVLDIFSVYIDKVSERVQRDRVNVI